MVGQTWYFFAGGKTGMELGVGDCMTAVPGCFPLRSCGHSHGLEKHPLQNSATMY